MNTPDRDQQAPPVMSRAEALDLLIDCTPYGTEGEDRTRYAVDAVLAAFEQGRRSTAPTDLSAAILALKLPIPAWARDHHGETEVYTADDLRALLQQAAELASAPAAPVEPEAWLNDEDGDLQPHMGAELEAPWVALVRRSAAAPAAVGWMPIESAPKDAVILIGMPIAGTLRADDRRVFEGRWDEAQGTWTSVNGFIVLTGATHWQPLPSAPPTARQAQEPEDAAPGAGSKGGAA